jgi:deazaflavin-dependent oxidoreductase (nitroreductase family)
MHRDLARRRAVRLALTMPRLLYHVGLGRALGHRFLLLEHRGRRTGARYEVMLEVLRWDADRREAFVLAGFGRGASWLRNLEAGSPLEVTIGGERFRPAARVVGTDEGAAELARYEDAHPLARPLVRRVLARLADVPYDGSDAARRRIVERLPVVALRAP